MNELPAVIRWYTVRAPGPAGEEVLYSGPVEQHARDAVEAARTSKRHGSARLEESSEYPPPERNEACRCRGMPFRQMACPFGHMTECHYPLVCHRARCGHFGSGDDHPDMSSLTDDEKTALWLAQAVRDDDEVFRTSPDAGDPSCTCSRCRTLIDEDEVPVRMFDATENTERRYHAACLGLPSFVEWQEDEEEQGAP